MDGIPDICAGLFVTAVGVGRIKMYRDESANDRFLRYYGKWYRIGGPLIVLFGIVRFVAQIWTR